MKIYINRGKVFRGLAEILMIWCIIQDVALALLYRVTKSVLLTNLFFYSKDAALIILFFGALNKIKIKKNYAICLGAYFISIVAGIIIAYSRGGVRYLI